MHRDKTISLVIPAYNEEKLIVPTLQSVPELIDNIYVVDDGSKDGTCDRVRQQALADPRVQLIEHGHNQGVGQAIISGYLQSSRIVVTLPSSPAGITRCRWSRFPICSTRS